MDRIPENIEENFNFPVVAIGASAGGIEAMCELLRYLPSDTGMAYVYIQHLDPTHESNLSAIFSRETEIPVQEAQDKAKIFPNHLYIIPPNKELALIDGSIEVLPRPALPYANTPINHFFTSLAEKYKEAAIGIILSGNATDGTLGLKAIKLAGGLTMAQDSTARFQGMPKSAMSENAVDLVLPPRLIADELGKIGREKDTYFTAIKELNEESIDHKDEDFLTIINLINRSTNVDFSQYKMKTIKRRLIRRMLIFKLRSLKEYAEYISNHPQEVNLLYQDLLIHVTSFFRDKESMEFLRKSVLPDIIKSKLSNDPIRIWVPACSSGQEPYSLAIMLVELTEEKYPNLPIQIFATDISEAAINKARLGIYTHDEVNDLSPKRLQRFFIKTEEGYRIIKSLRDMCVFATHNIVKDPPFSRLDLISCCNLLIYLDTILQKKILATFHYSLNNNGFIILGKSESVGTSGYLFSQLDKKFKIFAKKKEAVAKAVFEISYGNRKKGNQFTSDLSQANYKNKGENDLERLIDNLLLKKFTPASVVVNLDLEIIQFRGSTGLYLEPSPGKASLNLLKMAKPGLGFELRNIVHKANKSGKPVKKAGLQISIDAKPQKVSIEAIPLKENTEEEYFLLVFEKDKATDEHSKNIGRDHLVKQLEAELQAIREDMRQIVESQEAANEELQSANEEIVSSNEELQSINEELETSKEEIESSNEELITINQELQVRNDQLIEVQEYSEVIFSLISESLLILDKNLRVKSANLSFYNNFHVSQQETEGRLLYDLGNGQWNIPALRKLLEEIIPRNSYFKGYEVDHTFQEIGKKIMLLNAKKIVKINHQELILLTIEDVTEQRKTQKELIDKESRFRNIADSIPVMIWVTGTDKLCHFLNLTWLKFTGKNAEDAIGRSWTISIHPEDRDLCQKLFDESFIIRQPFDKKHRMVRNDGIYRWVHSKASPNYSDNGEFTGYTGTTIELDE